MTPLKALLDAEELLSKENQVWEQLSRRHRVLVKVFDASPEELDQAVKLFSLKTNQLYVF